MARKSLRLMNHAWWIWLLVVEGVQARHRGGEGWFRRGRHVLTLVPSSTHRRHPLVSLSTLDVRGGENNADTPSKQKDEYRISSAKDTTSYHLLSVLPASELDHPAHEWLPPGCATITNTSVTMHWGHPEVWQATNIPLVESLALVSDVVVLTVANSHENTLTPEVGDALQRGWQRRQAQGLQPGRLWMVWTGEGNENTMNQWVDNLVVQEWTSQLAKSPIQDWQLCEGPSKYTMAVRDFVQQQQQTRSDLSMLVPMDGVPTLLSRVYTTVRSDNPQTSRAEQLFLSDKSVQALSEMPAMIEASLKGATNPSGGQKEPQTYASDTADSHLEPEDDSSDVWFQLEQVQNKLDEYWLTGSTSGLTMPPDLLQALQPVLPKNRQFSRAAAWHERLATLTEQHAIILRDYYGRLYESLLENGRANSDGKTMSSLLKQYQSVAQRVTKAVRRHVKNDSVQQIYQNTYQGLQDDFSDINDRWQSAADVLFEDEQDDQDQAADRRRVPPWLRRLAVRVLVLGVNYLQGWLAWQGVQRAALARERQLPKFPLF